MFVAADRYKLTVSLVVLFATVGGITLAYTFVDILFLSTYPASLLPYLFLGKTLTILAFTFIVGRLAAQGSRWVNAGMLGFAAVTVAVSRGLLGLDVSGFPFALSLWLDVIAVLAGVIAFSAVNEVFDIRQMKKFGQWIYATGGLGGLAFGASVPWLIGAIGVNNLLPILALALLTAAIGLAALQPLPTSVKESRRAAHPLKYPLFVRTAAAFVLLLTIDTFADFALKNQVKLNYSRDQIGAFMGPFYGATNAVTVALQMSVVGLVLKRFGIRGLLLAMPLLGIVAAACLVVAPGLWTAAGFRMGETILRRGFDDFGRSLAINPLPAQIRRSVRMLWNGLCAPIGTGVAGALLFLLTTLPSVGVITAILSVAWIWLVFHVLAAYRDTLDEAVRMGRFTLDTEALDADPQLLHTLVDHSLASTDESENRFGLDLLRTHELALPPQLGYFLRAETQGLRAAAVEVVEARRDPQFEEALVERLDVEQVPEIRLRLYRALGATGTALSVDAALRFLDSELPEDVAGAALVLVKCSSGEHVALGESRLAAMAGAPDARSRRCVAKVASALGPAGRDQLQTLLRDDNPGVTSAALVAAASLQSAELLPEFIRRLGGGRTAFMAGSVLANMGAAAIPDLVEVAQSDDFRRLHIAVHTLSRMNERAVEGAFARLHETQDVYRRSVVSEAAAQFARRFGVSADFREFAHAALDEAADDVARLRSCLGVADVTLRTEVTARLELAQKRLLSWFAVLTDPVTVIDVIPVVVNRSMSASPERAMAMELLDTLGAKSSLKRALAALEGGRTLSANVDELRDDWLRRVSHRSKGGDMDSTQIAILLRNTSLFGQLPGEALLAIGELCEAREMAHGDALYEKGDYPSGLYVIASGFVNLMQGDEILETLRRSEVVGELELLDESPRLTDAVAATDGTLLYINKQTFDGLTEDIPEMLRALAQRVVKSLRNSLLSANLPKTPPAAPADETVLHHVRTDRSGFRRLEQNHSVNVRVPPGKEVGLQLASYTFTLGHADKLYLMDSDGRRHELNERANMVGRDPRCDVVLSADLLEVSRQHLVIVTLPNGAMITNLSAVGTWVKEDAIE